VTARRYSVFGRVLESDIPLPELREVDDGEPYWRFRVVEELPPTTNAVVIGEDPLYGSVSARLVRHDAGMRIDVDDTGSFELGTDGREIRWAPLSEPWWGFGRSHLIGRVLATALHLEGTVTLHASAVESAEGVAGFLAPKHFGKSTIGLRLVRAGMRFVTDDSLAVSVRDSSVVASPGVPSLRVTDPAGAPTDLMDGAVIPEPGRDGKIALPPLPERLLMSAPTALCALYLLRPQKPGGDAPSVARTLLPESEAVVRLMGQFKIGSMLGPAAGVHLLETATRLSRRVPVYGLEIVRDLERLPDVVATISAWHGVPDGLGEPGVAG